MAAQIKKKKTIKKWIFIVLIAAVAALVLYLLFVPKNKVFYKEGTVRAQDIYTYYSFSGNIESKKDTVTFSSANDQVRKINVAQGDQVNENDVILITQSGQKYKANINGTLSSLKVDEKDSFLSGTELYRIADFSSPQVLIKVDEYDVGALSVGMPVTVYVHPLKKEVEGIISEISLEATVTDNISFYEALVDVVQDGSLRMGMSCEVTMLKDQVFNAAALPIEAVQYDQDFKPYINTYGNNQNDVVQLPITLGINDGTYVQIESGLAAGDRYLMPVKDSLYMMPMGRQGGN